MQVSVVVDDNMIYVNGFAERCDLSNMPDYIHALQWYGAWGEIEFRGDDDGNRLPNKRVSDFNEFKKYISAWEVEAQKES
jgi:hypothetical protein